MTALPYRLRLVDWLYSKDNADFMAEILDQDNYLMGEVWSHESGLGLMFLWHDAPAYYEIYDEAKKLFPDAGKPLEDWIGAELAQSKETPEVHS